MEPTGKPYFTPNSGTRDLGSTMDGITDAKVALMIYDELSSDLESDEERRLRRAQDMHVFALGLERLADQAYRDRKPIEDRWVEDVRQFKGLVDLETLAKLTDKDSDQVHNITRAKTNGAISRISDMLFQTDAPNWDVGPTPVSAQEEEISRKIDAEEKMKQDRMRQIQQAQMGQMPTPMPQGVEEEERTLSVKERAERMRDTIKDQLEECDYENVGRKVIRQACLLGTGILKGPVIKTDTKKVWTKRVDDQGNVVHVIDYVVEDKPSVEFVPTWDFFPDLSATTLADCEYVFQRHYMTRKQLTQMLNREDVIHENIKLALESEPSRTPTDYLTQLRTMAGFQPQYSERRYLIWEYHGPLTIEQLAVCGCEVEPWMEGAYEGVIWFVEGGIVIKAAINPLDTQERPFGVFCFEEDESCIFGEGVPRLLRNGQRVVNACWRKIDDNSGLSTGPMLVVDDTIVEPVPIDGKISWEMKAKKVWRKKKSQASINDAFATFSIDSHLTELQAIMSMAKQFSEEEAMIPLISQGQAAEHITDTAHGLELLMNNANTMMRRPVKSWDDNITVPMITRFYDFNMQFNPDDRIKGDYNVAAKGTSALLLKETQARNLVNLSKMAQMPTFAPLTIWAGLYREVVKAMQLEHKVVVKDDDTIAREEEIRRQTEGEPLTSKDKASIQINRDKIAFERDALAQKMEDNAEERRVKLELAKITREDKIMQLALQEKKTVAEIKLELEREVLKTERDRTIIADKHKSAMNLPSGKVAG